MFCGMSSVKEYWKRARSTAQSDFETSSSSDYSFGDSNSSISKEYRDASCNVDSDDSTHELIDENVLSVENKLRPDIDESTTPTRPDNDRVKSSRYVRWDVLVSLGIGLWAVLCIVDLLHSEKSVTRDWLFATFRGRTIPTEAELPKKLDLPVLWYSNLWCYGWKFTTIMTSGGAYALLLLLIIVFCADPRVRSSTGPRYPVKDEPLPPEVAPPEALLGDSILPNESSVFRKKSVHRCLDGSELPNSVSVRLELPPSLDLLQRKMFFSMEKRARIDFKKIGNSPTSGRDRCTRERRFVRIFDERCDRSDESATCFSVDRRLVELLEANNCPTLRLTSVERRWSSFGKVEAVVKDSVSLCRLVNTGRSNLNLNASTFDLEIGEYLGRTRQSSSNAFVASRRDRGHERRRNFFHPQPGVSNRGESAKTRIITSSPAFKKFFSTLRHNNNALP